MRRAIPTTLVLLALGRLSVSASRSVGKGA